VGSSVTLIDETALRRDQSISVADALRQVPSVSVTRNGGPGAFTSVRLRGGEADQTVVLIDEVKVNDPAAPGGGYNFANLLTGPLTSVEVLAGPQSTLYGSQAIGGVVAVTTRLAEGPLARELAGEYGGEKSVSVRASASTGGPRVGWALAASHFQTEGISALAAPLGGKERDATTNNTATARLLVHLNPHLSLDVRLHGIKAEVGNDGYPAPDYVFADTKERTQSEEVTAYAGLKLSGLDGRLTGRLGASRARIARVNSDPDAAPTVTFDALGETDRWDGLVRYEPSAKVQVIGGFEHEAARYSTLSPSSFDPSPAPQAANTDMQAIFVQGQVRPVSALVATLGARHTRHARFGDAINLRATLAFAPQGWNTIVRASLGDGFKAPTLFQLFSDYGNEALRPERAGAWDVGFEHRAWAGRLVVTTTYFEREARDQIDFVSCFGITSTACNNRPFGTYGNVARTRAQGVDVSFALTPWAGWKISGVWSDLRATNRSEDENAGKKLARRPGQIGNLTLGYDWAQGHNLALSLYDVSASFDDAANRNRVAPYNIITLRGQYALSPGLSLYGRIENAGDRIYQSTLGYGTPRRQAFVGVRRSF
jgi:vitamin B12 transporter